MREFASFKSRSEEINTQSGGGGGGEGPGGEGGRRQVLDEKCFAAAYCESIEAGISRWMVRLD